MGTVLLGDNRKFCPKESTISGFYLLVVLSSCLCIKLSRKIFDCPRRMKLRCTRYGNSFLSLLVFFLILTLSGKQGDGSCVYLIFNNSGRREGTVLLLPLRGVKRTVPVTPRNMSNECVWETRGRFLCLPNF